MKIAIAAVALYTAGLSVPVLASSARDRDAHVRDNREITATYELNDAQIVTPGLKGVASARREYGLDDDAVRTAAVQRDGRPGPVQAAPRP